MVSDSLRQSSLLSTACLQCMADQDVMIRLSLSTHREDIDVVLTVVIRLNDVKIKLFRSRQFSTALSLHCNRISLLM